ncbi:MAG: patatin-like phospholipase family protein [Thiolinea sp.]
MLNIYAGQTALQTIRKQGFTPDLFTTLLGASGGPKWFVLYGLDKYLFAEFFKDRSQPLNMIGSSVGSFRAACFAQPDPVAATERMAKGYIETTYRRKYVSPKEVTDSGRAMLRGMLGKDGVSAILNNPVFKAHFIAARAKGLAASENRALQGLGLLKSSRNNRKARSSLAQQFERVIFQPADSQLAIDDPDGFVTHHVPLSTENTLDAILASGSLPVMMQGIRDIQGTPTGIYRDGGIIDYHFDFAIENDGLILYPHFSAALKAGWFDKKLPRGVRAKHFDRVVLLCPSEEFIAALPYGKIPDRSDFTRLSDEERMSYWRVVTQESERLAAELARTCEHQSFDQVRAIEELTG